MWAVLFCEQVCYPETVSCTRGDGTTYRTINATVGFCFPTIYTTWCYFPFRGGLAYPYNDAPHFLHGTAVCCRCCHATRVARGLFVVQKQLSLCVRPMSNVRIVVPGPARRHLRLAQETFTIMAMLNTAHGEVSWVSLFQRAFFSLS